MKKASAPAAQVALAKQLIDSLAGDFDPKKYKDGFRDRVLDLIKKKGRGEQSVAAPEAEAAPPVTDLMEALRASLGGGGGGAKAGGRKRTGGRSGGAHDKKRAA